jgi:peptidoglycan/xylan/chitin deacetylase (PgdA/CDA1 family)
MTGEPFTHELYRGISRLHWASNSKQAGTGSRILMYHSVGGALPEDPYGTSIDPSLFKTQMERLAARRAECPIAGLSAPTEGKFTLAITFDDGYKDTLTAAAPILAALDLPMTVFMTTAHLSEESRLYLSAQQLKTLAHGKGVTIGAHGHTHTPLDTLSDAALKEELTKSRKILEDLVGGRVNSLSYPHGRVDRRVRDAAQAAGYELGACSRYGLNNPDRDPLLLCRTEITAWDDLEAFGLKIGGHWDWFRWRHKDPQKW